MSSRAADHWTGLDRAIAVEAVWRISQDPARVMGALTELVDDEEARGLVLPVIAEIGPPMAHVLPRLRELLAAPSASMRLIEAVAAIDAELATGFIPLVRDRGVFQRQTRQRPSACSSGWARRRPASSTCCRRT